MPQWAGSFCRSRHWVPHTVRPWVQSRAQRPATQASPAAQAASQAPQWATLVWVSTQRAPQAVSPAPQVAAHTPRVQRCPSAQAESQAPQWAGSVAGSTQRPPHTDCPSGHRRAQRPATQRSEKPQAVPQAPQCRASASRSAHTSPQSVCRAGQRGPTSAAGTSAGLPASSTAPVSAGPASPARVGQNIRRRGVHRGHVHGAADIDRHVGARIGGVDGGRRRPRRCRPRRCRRCTPRGRPRVPAPTTPRHPDAHPPRPRVFTRGSVPQGPRRTTSRSFATPICIALRRRDRSESAEDAIAITPCSARISAPQFDPLVVRRVQRPNTAGP
jgi:hypothetical protein